MPLRNVVVVWCFIIISVAATSVPCAAEDLPAETIEFFRRRDQWLMDKAISEMTVPQPDSPEEKAVVELREELAKKIKLLDETERQLADIKKALEAIEKRVFRNTLKNDKSLKATIAKDKSRVEQYRQVLVDLNANAIELRACIDDTQKKIVELRMDADNDRRERMQSESDANIEHRKHARERVLILRKNLSLMPPTARLDLGNMKVGSIGAPPPWPIGLDDLNVVDRQEALKAISAIQQGQRPTVRGLLALEEIGGLAAAKNKHNLRIIQVFDSRLLLVSFVGGERFSWPSFLLDVGETSTRADGETLSAPALLYVSGTHRYKAADGSATTKFILRPFDVKDMPPITAK